MKKFNLTRHYRARKTANSFQSISNSSTRGIFPDVQHARQNSILYCDGSNVIGAYRYNPFTLEMRTSAHWLLSVTSFTVCTSKRSLVVSPFCISPSEGWFTCFHFLSGILAAEFIRFSSAAASSLLTNHMHFCLILFDKRTFVPHFPSDLVHPLRHHYYDTITTTTTTVSPQRL